jgi:hypothetical protein
MTTSVTAERVSGSTYGRTYRSHSRKLGEARRPRANFGRQSQATTFPFPLWIELSRFPVQDRTWPVRTAKGTLKQLRYPPPCSIGVAIMGGRVRQ